VQIRCPRCGNPIPGVDIDLTTQSAVCRPCGEVVGLALQAAPIVPAVDAFSTSAVTLYRPTDLRWAELNDAPGESSVTITPPRAAALGLLFFALFWDGFLVFWYAIAASSKHPSLVMLLFPLLHVGAGLLITHAALCGLINRTTLRVGRDAFEFRRGPIPQGGAVREPTMNIAGFEVATLRGGAMQMRSRGQASRPTWGVHLLTRDGRAVPVRLGFLDQAHASYAAARLSQMLGDAQQKATYRE
jgi:hypothetical protein